MAKTTENKNNNVTRTWYAGHIQNNVWESTGLTATDMEYLQTQAEKEKFVINLTNFPMILNTYVRSIVGFLNMVKAPDESSAFVVWNGDEFIAAFVLTSTGTSEDSNGRWELKVVFDESEVPSDAKTHTDQSGWTDKAGVTQNCMEVMYGLARQLTGLLDSPGIKNAFMMFMAKTFSIAFRKLPIHVLTTEQDANKEVSSATIEYKTSATGEVPFCVVTATGEGDIKVEFDDEVLRILKQDLSAENA